MAPRCPPPRLTWQPDDRKRAAAPPMQRAWVWITSGNGNSESIWLWRASPRQRPASAVVPRSSANTHRPPGGRRTAHSAGGLSADSRKGNCYDNTPMERFWGSLKNELVHHQRHATRADAQSAIQEYIESFYNRRRCSLNSSANSRRRLETRMHRQHIGRYRYEVVRLPESN